MLSKVENLKTIFVRVLTEDGPTSDRRRKDFNQAIFAPVDQGGWAVFDKTDLDMVLSAFDKAVKIYAKSEGR